MRVPLLIAAAVMWLGLLVIAMTMTAVKAQSWRVTALILAIGAALVAVTTALVVESI